MHEWTVTKILPATPPSFLRTETPPASLAHLGPGARPGTSGGLPLDGHARLTAADGADLQAWIFRQASLDARYRGVQLLVTLAGPPRRHPTLEEIAGAVLALAPPGSVLQLAALTREMASSVLDPPAPPEGERFRALVELRGIAPRVRGALKSNGEPVEPVELPVRGIVS